MKEEVAYDMSLGVQLHKFTERVGGEDRFVVLTRDQVFALALKSGVIDPDLSEDGQMVTDYGNSEEALMEFARLIVEMLSPIDNR
jgi:hypothetical protein